MEKVYAYQFCLAGIRHQSARGMRAEAQVNVSGFVFFNWGSGMCLQPTSDVELNGISITQQSCNSNSQSQSWTVRLVSNGDLPERYQVQNVSTGQCLDDTDGKGEDGTPVQQWTCNLTSTTMQWTITHAPQNLAGYYEIKNVRTGKCLDVRAGSLEAGAVIQIYHCTNSTTVTNWAQLFGLSGPVFWIPF